MVKRLGIIPAAGSADRFGGIPKEMLSVGGNSLLRHAVQSLKLVNCDVIVVITNGEKINLHIQHLKDDQIYYVIQRGQKDAWSAIQESFSLCGTENYYVMPDTYFPVDILGALIPDNFMIGYFETKIPKRFGVLTNDGIKDKEDLQDGIYPAWGVLAWTDKVVEFWKDNQYESHTHAFNDAIKDFGYSAVQMDYYYDFASWEDYQDFVRKVEL